MAYRRARAVEQMMGGMMSGMVIGPFWYVMGTIIVVVAVGGFYGVVRGKITGPPDTSDSVSVEADDPENDVAVDVSHPDVLDMLPEDERRILNPVIESPGITQVALRDRSEFSKAKVSQTVSTLEKRGVVYRERQGRTYRIYPSDSLQERLIPSSGMKDGKNSQ